MNGPLHWIEEQFQLQEVTSDQLVYQNQESQAGYSLMVIHQPFDPNRKGHWWERGQELDFSLVAHGGRVLDIGPGDGWPSLPMAPFAAEVVAADASERRVRVCTQNAERLGIKNFRAVHLPAGRPLPFPDERFDAVTAASSIEETPDPYATLQEVYRVLKPGGRLRMRFDDVTLYRGDSERDFQLYEQEPGRSLLVINDRDPDAEELRMYGLRLNAGRDQVRDLLTDRGRITGEPELVERLHLVSPLVAEALTCRLHRPGRETVLGWLREIGFESAVATYPGGVAGKHLFEVTPEEDRPQTLSELDRLLQPAVEVVTRLGVPSHVQAHITATK